MKIELLLLELKEIKEKGLTNSINKELEKVKKDIILLSNDNVIYNKGYKSLILDEFKKKPNADIIIFNISGDRRINKSKRMNLINYRDYSYYRIAFRNESIKNKNMVFNSFFENDNDTSFVIDAIKNKLKVYVCSKYIGKLDENENIYNDKYFFEKGALCTAISTRFRKLVMLKYLIVNRKEFKNISFFKAYKYMKNGSLKYLERIYKKL